MKHFSRIHLTLYYLGCVQGVTQASGQTIHCSILPAIDWYKSKATDFDDRELEILQKHGFTKESWEEVIYNSFTFYFAPTEQMNNCNREIRALFHEYIMINGDHRSANYTYQILTHMAYRGTLHRIKRKGIYYYTLPKKIIDQIMDALVEQNKTIENRKS